MNFQDFIDAVFLHSGFITLSVFLLLLVLSVVTWGLIVAKVLQLRNEDTKDKGFVVQFNQAEDLHTFSEMQREHGPIDYDLGIVFDETMRIVDRFKVEFPRMNFVDPVMEPVKENFDQVVGRTVERIALQMQERRDKHLAILGTTSNIAPFLGVFGTVVGIINAFALIGKTGSADLAVVAPAISEALIATALGIFVAIPSSAAFNFFQYRLQNLSQSFDRFVSIMLNRIQVEILLKDHQGKSTMLTDF